MSVMDRQDLGPGRDQGPGSSGWCTRKAQVGAWGRSPHCGQVWPGGCLGKHRPTIDASPPGGQRQDRDTRHEGTVRPCRSLSRPGDGGSCGTEAVLSWLAPVGSYCRPPPVAGAMAAGCLLGRATAETTDPGCRDLFGPGTRVCKPDRVTGWLRAQVRAGAPRRCRRRRPRPRPGRGAGARYRTPTGSASPRPPRRRRWHR